MKDPIADSVEIKSIAGRIKPGCTWSDVFARAKLATPEPFAPDGGLLNLIDGEWGSPGRPRPTVSPTDGTVLGSLPMLESVDGNRAVRAAAAAAPAWAARDLDARRACIAATCKAMKTHRDTLAQLILWEIGKTWTAACNDVDRCISGVEWYVEQAPRMLEGRKPLGLVSNIASWNYPLSVLMHAVLVQALSGNAVIAKTPTDGGGYVIAVCMELARREGVPVSLVSGSGGALSDALVRHELIDCMSFVGGRATGRDIATDLVDTTKRYMLEMEGINAYGIWEFSQWSTLGAQIKKGYEYGKQRCTAYPRYVVQRKLLPAFLETHYAAVKSLRIGHPAVVANETDPLPTLDFGPLINARKVQELRAMIEEAELGGGIPVLASRLEKSLFLQGQSTDSYFAPYALLNVPRRCQLYHGEPFGPVDTIVVVDRVEELVAEMNVSNGSLCCSLATDDEKLAMKLKEELRGFKFGHNVLRSRGDKSEAFGGLGLSWKGCFVGGEHLVRAVTKGPGDETLAGHFEDHFRMPDGL